MALCYANPKCKAEDLPQPVLKLLDEVLGQDKLVTRTISASVANCGFNDRRSYIRKLLVSACAAVLGARCIASSLCLSLLGKVSCQPAPKKIISVIKLMCYDATPLKIRVPETQE